MLTLEEYLLPSETHGFLDRPRTALKFGCFPPHPSRSGHPHSPQDQGRGVKGKNGFFSENTAAHFISYSILLNYKYFEENSIIRIAVAVLQTH